MNQTRVMLDNKVPMNLTWVGPAGYRQRWSWMTKHTWLAKPQNFERVPSNLLGRLIHGYFGWGCVIEIHPKEVETWLVYKWTIDSRSVWFSYSKFLRTSRISSLDVNMTNIMKYDTNKRWVICNFLKTFPLKKRGNPH